MIKKFKNGNIRLYAPKKNSMDDYLLLEDGTICENYYHENMNMSDLSFNQINGYMYLVDFNTNLVYELESQNIQNPLKWLLDSIAEEGKYYLYPLSKNECKQLLMDLKNDY